MQKIVFILLAFFLLAEGCAVFRKSEKASVSTGQSKGEAAFAGSVAENNLSRNNFIIRKAEITVTDEKISSRFTATIRFRRPDSLLVTARSRIGVEAARILLTADTLLINDRINHKLLKGNTKWLAQKYGVERSLIFTVFGDFIIDDSDVDRKLNCRNGSSGDMFIINERNVKYNIDCKRGKITSAYFEGGLTTGNITMEFGNFKNTNGMVFPREIEISDDLRGTSIKIVIDNVETDWKGNIEFIPGNGYQVIYLK